MKLQPKLKVHFQKPGQTHTACGLGYSYRQKKERERAWEYPTSSNIHEVTCLNCTGKYARDHEANLRTVDHVVRNKVMEAEEIMTTLRRAFTDAKEMSERASGISAICNLVTMGVMTDEELVAAFERALVKQVMEA
jgi:hypothetical protein